MQYKTAYANHSLSKMLHRELLMIGDHRDSRFKEVNQRFDVGRRDLEVGFEVEILSDSTIELKLAAQL